MLNKYIFYIETAHSTKTFQKAILTLMQILFCQALILGTKGFILLSLLTHTFFQEAQYTPIKLRE